MAFDGIVTKAIASELQQISGARIDKIFQPNKNTLLLGFYLDGTNYLINICIDSKNYRVHLTTHTKKNPQIFDKDANDISKENILLDYI